MICPRARLCECDRRQRDSRLAGRCAERVRLPTASSSITWVVLIRRRQNVTLLIEINRDRPNSFSQPRRTRGQRYPKIAKANVRMQFDFYHVQIYGGDLIHRLEKFLPSLAICSAQLSPRAMNRMKARSTIRQCSRLWTSAATTGGSALNIGRAGEPKRDWDGRNVMAWFPPVNCRLIIKLLENSCFSALRADRALLDLTACGNA